MTIRRITENDLATRVKWMNHPNVYSSMHYEVPVLLENTISWYKNNLNNSYRADIVFEENGSIVAMGGLTGIDTKLKKAELYIFVDPFRQSKGTGTVATMLLCQYGFSTLGLQKIYLVTNESNIPAQKVYQKVGFQLEGRLRKETIVNNKIEDRLYYGLFYNELINISDDIIK